jgi:hypothetical protein
MLSSGQQSESVKDVVTKGVSLVQSVRAGTLPADRANTNHGKGGCGAIELALLSMTF